MPTVSVERTFFLRCLGQDDISDESLDTLLFDIGLELDDVVKDGDSVTYKIEVGANRYDLLCAEGIARTLNIFHGRSTIPEYTVIGPPSQYGSTLQMHVNSNSTVIRPHVVAAALYGIDFDDQIYNSFIDLQDKLHQNIGRKRSIVSIGTHDLDTVCGPFRYDGQAPDQIEFRALSQIEKMSAIELYNMYHATGSHLKPYLSIIGTKDGDLRPDCLHPVITDANGTVLSLPPVINGSVSALVAGRTRNVLVEVTATNKHKAVIALDTICAMFSQYCSSPFHVGRVDIYIDGQLQTDTLLKSREMEVSCREAKRITGLTDVSTSDVANMLSKMSLKAKASSDDAIVVTVSPTRHDVLHARDIYEDVAIAHGFNAIPTMPLPPTGGMPAKSLQLPINALSDKLRIECAMAGYTEVLTFSLCSKADLTTKLGLSETTVSDCAVIVANPKTVDFQALRTTLLPGLFKTLAANKDRPLPVRLFEISDIVIKSDASDVGAVNVRHLAALIMSNRSAMFEAVHGLLDRLMARLQLNHQSLTSDYPYYRLEPNNSPTYLSGRSASVIVAVSPTNEITIGRVGVINPNILSWFDLQNPCSVLEIDIEHFV